MHAAKTSNKKLIIDEMMAALAAKKKRSDYEENQENKKAQMMKNGKGGKTPSKNKSTNEKKDKPRLCSYCKNLIHIKKQCFYLHPDLRKNDWKPHEIKLQLIKQWNKKKNFVASKSKEEKKDGKIKKIRSMASNSDESDSSSNPFETARITK